MDNAETTTVTEPAPSKPLTEQQQWVGAVCEVTGWTAALMAGRAGKLVKALKFAGGSSAELLEHYGQVDHGAAWWWYRDDWRGKRGQRPGDNGIRETWGMWNKPIAVKSAGRYDGMLSYVEELERGEQS